MTNAPPSRNPANDDTLVGALREILRKQLQVTDNRLPAIVRSYDRTTNRARVQPLIQVLDTDGNRVSRAAVPSVPVFLPGGGGFFVSFHLPPGSLGWLQANDRDISLFLREYAEAAPGSQRLHTFEDGVFIPDIMTGYTIAAEDAQAAVFQSLDGSVRIALDTTGVRVTAPRADVVTGTSTVTAVQGTVTIDAANLQVNGDIGATGTITGDTDVVTGTVSLSGHTHDFTNADGILSTTQAPNP